jgi:hypothetical protein
MNRQINEGCGKSIAGRYMMKRETKSDNFSNKFLFYHQKFKLEINSEPQNLDGLLATLTEPAASLGLLLFACRSAFV